MTASRPIVQMIWTRRIDEEPMAGRLRVAKAIRAAVGEVAEVREQVLTPALAGGLRGMMSAGLAWLTSVVRGPLLPIQCVLYADRREARRMAAAVDPRAATIYLDGVRTYPVLCALRKRFPDKRIVVDLDDLMSRRMALLLGAAQPLSPGYLTSRLPAPVVRWLAGGLGRLVARYECATLPRVEAAITRLADAVVLLSAEDMRRLPGDGVAARVTILPGVAAAGRTPRLLPGPLRFIFVGSDTLTQNRLTIDHLLELWRDHRPAAELVIYGRQVRDVPLPPGVRLAGYVRDIADAYDGRSIMLTPSYLAGGIKTKVLEAFANGTPVIGNDATFEAMPLTDYPLVCADDAALLALLRDPDAHRARFEAAARAGADYLAREHSPVSFAACWRAVLGLDRETP